MLSCDYFQIAQGSALVWAFALGQYHQGESPILPLYVDWLVTWDYLRHAHCFRAPSMGHMKVIVVVQEVEEEGPALHLEQIVHCTLCREYETVDLGVYPRMNCCCITSAQSLTPIIILSNRGSGPESPFGPRSRRESLVAGPGV